MKRTLFLHTIASVLIVTAVFGLSCNPGPPNTNNSHNDIANQSSSPGNVNSQTVNGNINDNEDKNTNQAGAGDIDNSVANAETAMIFKVDKEVSLRSKGAADFVRILSALFRSGDVLRVGQQAVAWVTCPDGHVCPLSSGEYTDCCHFTCPDPIQMQPPEGTEVRLMMEKRNLPPGERLIFEESEKKIRQLGADQVVTQFLIANLYSSWKLKEANEEVDKLQLQLKDPEAPQKLNLLYLPMVRKTGDLYLKIDKKVEAERNYKQVVDLAPRKRDEKEEAAANVSLGQLYEKTGQKEAAAEKLNKATVLYEKQGDVQKATQTRRAMIKAQKP